MRIVFLLLLCISSFCALDNGLGLVPPMGFNSWYALHSHLTPVNYTWEPGYVLDSEIRDIARFMKDKGLQSLGYEYINLDDCIMWGRDANGKLIPDPQAFPHGVKSLADYVHSLGFKFGVYTDRGEYTCSCYAGGYKRPGSLHHEVQDAQTYAEWGVDYLKEDSCFASHLQAFSQYALMRDGLNKTGRPIFFELAWIAGETVAQKGYDYGNQWRIAFDDGGGWSPILLNIRVDKDLWKYAGPGGWNDPGLLVAGQKGMNYTQSRTHINFWSMLAAKLLISVDPRAMSPEILALYMNKEVISVDQDPLGKQAQQWQNNTNLEVWGRPLVGGDKALLFFNGSPRTSNVSCTGTCWANLGLKPGERVELRDMWAHKSLGTFSSGYSVQLIPTDSQILRATIVKPEDENGCTCSSSSCSCSTTINGLDIPLGVDMQWSNSASIPSNVSFADSYLFSVDFTDKVTSGCKSIGGGQGNICIELKNATITTDGACGTVNSDVTSFGNEYKQQIGTFTLGKSVTCTKPKR